MSSSKTKWSSGRLLESEMSNRSGSSFFPFGAFSTCAATTTVTFAFFACVDWGCVISLSGLITRRLMESWLSTQMARSLAYDAPAILLPFDRTFRVSNCSNIYGSWGLDLLKDTIFPPGYRTSSFCALPVITGFNEAPHWLEKIRAIVLGRGQQFHQTGRWWLLVVRSTTMATQRTRVSYGFTGQIVCRWQILVNRIGRAIYVFLISGLK